MRRKTVLEAFTLPLRSTKIVLNFAVMCSVEVIKVTNVVNRKPVSLKQNKDKGVSRGKERSDVIKE